PDLPDACGRVIHAAVKNRATFLPRSAAMSMSAFARGSLTAVVVVWTVMQAAQAQPQPAGTPQNRTLAPVNSGPNPYRVIRDWAQLTQEKRPGGGANGVPIDKDGTTVSATERSPPG